MKTKTSPFLFLAAFMLLNSSCLVFAPKKRHRRVVVVTSTPTIQHTPSGDVSYISEQPPQVAMNCQQ